MRRLLDSIVARPWRVALIVLLLMMPALAQLVDFESGEPRLLIDASLDALLPQHSPALEIYERTRASFGSDDVLLVAWLGDELFTPERLAGLKRLTRRLERMPQVERVDSLATALNVQVTDETTDIDAFLRVLPEDAVAAAAVRDAALANPLYAGRLIARDGRGLLLAVHFDNAISSATLAARVAEISAASREEAGNTTQFVTGPLAVRLEISRLLLVDLYRVMPLAVLGTLLVAAFSFRSLRGVFVPIIANAAALIGTLACFAASGHALNFVTVMLPPVIYVVGFAYAVHVVSAFDSAHHPGIAKADAVKAAIRHVAVPLTLTALTTAIGFASLALSSISSIRDFGLFATLGSMIAWVAALTVVPAGLMLLPARCTAATADDRLTAWAAPLARFDLRFRRPLLAAGACLAIASLACASRIEVSTDYLGNFAEDNPVRRNFSTISRAFSGAVPLQVVIESDIPQAFKSPAQLRIIGELQQWLKAQPEIGGVYSLFDYVRTLYAALAPDQFAQSPMPRTADLTDHLLLLGGGDDVLRFADTRFSTTVLHINSSAVSTASLNRLAERIDERLAELPSHLRGHVTGSSYVIAQTIDDIARGQVQSLIFALATIYLVLVALFGSWRVAALALVPNTLPLFAYFGLLGASGITLNLTTSLIASVVLGIAVDETIHFLSQFNVEARRHASEELGAIHALRTVLRPATFTTLSLCVGFLAMTAGELQYQVEFGYLAAATLFMALLLYLTLTPAISEQLHVVTLWDVLTLDLGAKPHETIPLFAGLTERQARVAALMGKMHNHVAGSRVMSVGEPGDTMWVVIDGELSASYPRDDGDFVLRTMTRGAQLGEIGLFKGQRTANIDTLTDVRVLCFSGQALQRLRKRYPRVAATLYRNIAAELATRLTETTTRLK